MWTQLPSPNGHSPQFSAHICCGQMAGWIKMLLGMDVGLSPDDCVRWGPSSPSQKGGGALPPIFGPCLLWPNGWMDQDGTWHEGGPQSRPHCLRWGPICPSPKGAQPQFSANVRCGQTATSCSMGLNSPRKKAQRPSPNFWSMPIVAKRLDG